jgi:porphobilinogen synthase
MNDFHRNRRFRLSPTLRGLVRENQVAVSSLVYPLFVSENNKEKEPIPAMPGQYRYGLDWMPNITEKISEKGIPAVLLFGIPKNKDEEAYGAWDDKGVVQQAILKIKATNPEMAVITDTCLCEYTPHGHCGCIIDSRLKNDQSLEILARIAISQAEAGADLVAPSAMLDGQVETIRSALDEADYGETGILSYSAKQASAFYGPFRQAANSTPAFGDRKSYQMDPANRLEAMREIASDLDEGADAVLIKPGLPCLDLVRDCRDQFDCPLAVYQVSGEYAMIRAAAKNGWVEEKPVVLETFLAFKRAGAQFIISYYAFEAADWINESR